MCSIILICKNNLAALKHSSIPKKNSKISIYQAKTLLENGKIIVTMASLTYKSSYINSFQEK